MPYIVIQQLRSPIRRPHDQRATLIGLGLNRIGRVSWLEDTPSVRGMIKQVSHLVQVLHDPLGSESLHSPFNLRTKKGMKMPQLPPVSSFLCNAFLVAKTKYPVDSAAWVDLSWRLSGRFALPPAITSIQRHGDLDLLLRCIEDESMKKLADRVDVPGIDLSFHYQTMLSENWVMGFYEIFRSFKERDKNHRKKQEEEKSVDQNYVSDLAAFKSIFKDLELLRMPLAKYEVAKDVEIKAPLVMRPVPSSNDTAQSYIYKKDDPSRHHIMPTRLSTRGSMEWLAFDHRCSHEYWVERRELADRMLALKDEVVPAGLLEASNRIPD